MSEPVLDLRGLVTELRRRDGGWTRVVDDVSLTVGRGEIVGLVGESGCGKSMTAFSIMQLFPTPAARLAAGHILFEGRDLRRLSAGELRRTRGSRLGMIFQDPATFLDPLLTVGDQIAEPLRAHTPQVDTARRMAELLDQMGLPDPALMARRYPHQLSGGQKQRALIASAIACSPALLIADEPTTALDVTVQAQILDLLRSLRDQMGLAILLITHDLGVVAEMCDRVYVMYAGRIIESNTVQELFRTPRHPYTLGLLRSTVSLEEPMAGLFAIPGVVPNLTELPVGCRFAPRCPLAVEQCAQDPPLLAYGPAQAACWRSRDVKQGAVWPA